MAKSWDPAVDMPDLSGKVAIVTGASVGIGFETVRLLASRGARVIATSRSEASIAKAVEKLRATLPDVDSVEWLQLELGDLKSIAGFAEEVKKKAAKVDILINNAAVGTASTELVAGRWEQHMAINVAGTFYLMNRLLPLLNSAAKQQDSDVRIICLGSVAPTTFIPATHEFPFLSPSLLTEPVASYPWLWRYVTQYIFQIDMIRYGVSKTAVVLMARELQRRLDARASPIVAITVHPGEVATEFQMANNNAVIAGLARLSFLTSAQGAVNPLFAATAREVRQRPDEFKGRFIMPVGQPGTSHPIAEERGQAEGLWENLTAQLNKELEAEGLPLLEAW